MYLCYLAKLRPPTTAATSDFWQIMSGSSHCEIVDGGRCVTDGSGDYSNNERCKVKALGPLTVTAVQYDVERVHDYVTLNGVRYKGDAGPQEVRMNRGDTWQWRSNWCNTREGFKLCASTAIEQTTPGNTMTPWSSVCVYACMYACMYVSTTRGYLYTTHRPTSTFISISHPTLLPAGSSCPRSLGYSRTHYLAHTLMFVCRTQSCSCFITHCRLICWIIIVMTRVAVGFDLSMHAQICVA